MLIDAPDRARRLARTIVSDIALYNKDDVKRGIENDSLFDDLAGELVAPEIQKATNFYDLAIVDVLVKPNGHIESSIW